MDQAEPKLRKAREEIEVVNKDPGLRPLGFRDFGFRVRALRVSGLGFRGFRCRAEEFRLEG